MAFFATLVTFGDKRNAILKFIHKILNRNLRVHMYRYTQDGRIKSKKCERNEYDKWSISLRVLLRVSEEKIMSDYTCVFKIPFFSTN